VRRYLSGEKKAESIPPVPIAERWMTKPVSLATGPGMHRFVWDLRWDGSGTSEELEEDDYGAPRGPRAAPGDYQVKLFVDGVTMAAPLTIQMDPRSKATAAELAEQQRLGLEIYGRVRGSRRALAEVKAAQSKLKNLSAQLKNEEQLRAQAENLERSINAINKGNGSEAMGLEAATGGLQAALRVVEGGDRTTPQQAMEVYRLSGDAATVRIAEWEKLKGGELAEFNRVLRQSGKQPIAPGSDE